MNASRKEGLTEALAEVQRLFPTDTLQPMAFNTIQATPEVSLYYTLVGGHTHWYCLIMSEKGDGSVVARGQGSSVVAAFQAARAELQLEVLCPKKS